MGSPLLPGNPGRGLLIQQGMSPVQGSTVQREVEQMLRLSRKRDIGRLGGRVDDVRDEEVRKGNTCSGGWTPLEEKIPKVVRVGAGEANGSHGDKSHRSI